MISTAGQPAPGEQSLRAGLQPRGWKTIDLGETCARVTTGKLDANAMKAGGAFPFFTCAREVYRINEYAFDGEALLVSGNGANVGYVHHFAGKFNAYQRTYVLIDFNVEVQFVRYFLEQNLAARISGEARYGNTPYITMDTLTKMEIVIPESSEEAQRIARALMDVDSLIASLKRLIAKTQAIKQGMMQQLLTGKTRLPGFADIWNKTVLGDHVVYVKVVALARAELDASSPIRYLHYGDIHTNDGVRIDAATSQMPRVAASKVRNAGRLQVGDLVFADASEDPAGVGKSVEVVSVPVEGLVPGLHTIAARFDKSFLADGFKAYLQFIPEFRESLLRLAAGTKVLSTTRKYISSVVLELPKVAEQRAIAAVLHDADSEIDALEHQLKHTRNIKQGMMQELLTGRTRLTPSGDSE